MGREEEWIWGTGEAVRGIGRSGGRGNCGQNMLYEGRINKNLKEKVYSIQLYPFIKHMFSSQEQNSKQKEKCTVLKERGVCPVALLST